MCKYVWKSSDDHLNELLLLLFKDTCIFHVYFWDQLTSLFGKVSLKTVFALYFNTLSRAGARPCLFGGHTSSAGGVCEAIRALTCFTFTLLRREVCNWGVSKCCSLFLLHPPLSHSQGNNAAADTGRHCVWLEDIQALTGETFRTDKKPDPANWEYKSLYRGDIARCVSRRVSLVVAGGRGLLSALSSQHCVCVPPTPPIDCWALSTVHLFRHTQ